VKEIKIVLYYLLESKRGEEERDIKEKEQIKEASSR
jgi:hypothetical protein